MYDLNTIISAISAAGTIIAAMAAIRSAHISRKDSEESREELIETRKRAELDRLHAQRVDFALTLFAYVNRWPARNGVQPKIPDQMGELRPKAAITQQGAVELADWTTKAVTKINDSGLPEEEYNSVFWEFKLELSDYVSDWIEDSSKLPQKPFNCKAGTIMQNEGNCSFDDYMGHGGVSQS